MHVSGMASSVLTQLKYLLPSFNPVPQTNEPLSHGGGFSQIAIDIDIVDSAINLNNILIKDITTIFIGQ